jgi:NAD+ diphosphatase
MAQASEQTKDGFSCHSCGKNIHYTSAPTSSVVVKVGSEMLLSIRGIEPHKGKIDIVGGFLKYGEDPLVGAVREFKEETGFEIDQKDLKFLTIGVDTYHYQGEDIFCFNVTYVLRLDQKPDLSPNDDISDLKWVPIDGEYEFPFKYLFEVHKELKKLPV